MHCSPSFTAEKACRVDGKGVSGAPGHTKSKGSSSLAGVLRLCMMALVLSDLVTDYYFSGESSST